MRKISFCIPTCRNEKEYISILLDSMETNFDRLDHEIIIFVDSDNQGTYEFLKSRDTKFEDIRIIKNPWPIPMGYQRNVNLMFKLAKYDIVSVIQSDMVVGKWYDTEILRHLKDENVIVSATRVEPSLHPPSTEKHTQDFGLHPSEFDFDKFNSFVVNNVDMENVTYYWFAPFTMYKSKWLEIGGHDTLFRRSREDSDILMRFRLMGIETIQCWSALVYHFTCVSSRGKDWFKQENQDRTKLQSVADNIELGKFFRKWKKFSHDANPMSDDEKYLYRYSLVTNTSNNTPIDKIIQITNYFDKVYLNDTYILSKVLNEINSYDNPANELFGYSEQEWDKYKKYFNRYEYDKIFLQKSDKYLDDIIVEVDVDKINNQERFDFIKNLNDIIHYQIDELGIFEYDIFKVTINKKHNCIMDTVIVNNPKLDLEIL